jgi:hypothetical protein
MRGATVQALIAGLLDAVADTAIRVRVDIDGVGHRGHWVRPSRGVPASLFASVVAAFADLQNRQQLLRIGSNPCLWLSTVRTCLYGQPAAR